MPLQRDGHGHRLQEDGFRAGLRNLLRALRLPDLWLPGVPAVQERHQRPHDKLRRGGHHVRTERRRRRRTPGELGPVVPEYVSGRERRRRLQL